MEVGQNNNKVPVPASETSSQTNDNKKSKKKTLLIVHPCGKPVGQLSQKFYTRVGQLVRVHCPISYKDWRCVPKNFKQDIWNALMHEYEFNVPSQLVQPHVEETYSQKFRSGKHTLRTNLDDATKDEALAACPHGINPSHWVGFVNNEYEEKMIAKRKQNIENKKMDTICHNLGRCSYLHNNYILEETKGIIIKDRAGTWMKGHENKDGVVHPTAIKQYEKIKAAKEKRKNMNEDESGSNLALDSDVFAEVFGSDNGKGHVRAYSSCMSKKRAQHGLLATSLIESGANKSIAPLEAKIDSLEKHVGDLKTMTQQLQSQIVTQRVAGIPILSFRTGSNSEVHHTSGMNLNSIFQGEMREDMNSGSRVSENPYVDLLNRQGVVVGNGYIVTGKDGEFCHCRKVLSTERKIRIEVVSDINAPVPNAPQGDGHFTLGGFSEGGGSIIHIADHLNLQYKCDGDDNEGEDLNSAFRGN